MGENSGNILYEGTKVARLGSFDTSTLGGINIGYS